MPKSLSCVVECAHMSSPFREHMVMPDTQLKPGEPIDHMRWAGLYAAKKKPQVIIHLGDHWDFPSLSYYDRGTKSMEGRRFSRDISTGNEGMRLFWDPIIAEHNRNGYWPEEAHFIFGNHEERLARYIENNAVLEDAIGFHQLDLEHWTQHPFLELCIVDGIAYTHFLANPMTGKPLGGMVSTRLKNAGMSFTMGHQQTLDHAVRFLANGEVQRGLVAGAFYQHDEPYKGAQGNRHWRGIIYKHEVRNGNYDMMEVSMDYLRREFAGV